MEKVTKKDLNERLLMVETLLGLHRVLPEQISNKQANDAIFRMQCALSSGKELAERESKLKVLDQSIFNGLSSEYKFAAIDGCTGRAYAYEQKPHIPVGKDYWRISDGMQSPIAYGYDTNNWQNSLIERDKVELTGSELCLQLLNLDRDVMCDVKDGDYRLIFAHDGEFFISHNKGERECHERVTPINNQGEPLTASEVGL